MAEDALLASNLSVFERHFPELHARLKAIEPISRIVYGGEGPADIDLGSGRLYRRDGRAFAREQVDDFLRSPFQVGYVIPQPADFDSLLSRRTQQEMLESIMRHDVGELPQIPCADTGYSFIFGVGLGYHLPALLDGLSSPHVVICEAFEEFLLASMRVVDWSQLRERCVKRGVTMHLICHSAPEQITQQAIAIIDRYGPVLLDGSYFYEHYGLWAFQEAKRRLINELPRHMIARGYFEDERKMVRNTVTNFHKNHITVLGGGFRVRSNIPVFVVAAGPSLDEAIPYLKEWRDHALVFSAGSGLQPCLKNGIIPDFHIELENTYSIFEKLDFILKQNSALFANGKFEGIRLITSSSVTPSVTALFDDIYYFLREASSSSLSIGAEFGSHSGTGPTVANTALSVIARMGLGDVYLFGVDCGWRSQSDHHAKDTIYYTAQRFMDAQYSGAYTLPGNFGGTVGSDITFDWCRNMLEQAIAAFHLNVINCSNGALINGATPRVPEALHFDGDPLRRDEVIGAILANRPHFAPGEFFRTRPMAVYQQQLDRYEAAVMPLVREAIRENWNFRKFHDAAWRDFGGEASDRGLGMATWVQVSTIGMLKHTAILMNRIADQEKRQAVTQDFYRLFEQIHEEMFAEARAHMADIDSWVNGGPEPEWTNGWPVIPGCSY